MTLKQSSAVHIQALVSVDGILPGSSFKLQLLVINLASVPGRQLVNSPTAQSLERCRQADMTLQSFQKHIKEQSKSKRFREYLFCGLFVFIGIYLFYNYCKSNYKFYMFLIPSLMIFVGCRGFFRISKSLNQAFVIDSPKQIPEKLESIKACFSSKEKIEFEENGSFLKFKYEYLFYNKIVIDLYLETDKVMFIVTRDDIQPIVYYLDLGATKKESKNNLSRHQSLPITLVFMQVFYDSSESFLFYFFSGYAHCLI